MQQLRRFSSFPPPFPAPGKKDQLIQLLQARLAEHPTKDLVHFFDAERLSISRVNTNARAFGTALRWLKHDPKSTVLVVQPNNAERLVLQLACLYSGCKIALAEQHAPIQDLDIFQLLQASKPKSLFVTENLVRSVRQAVPELTFAGWVYGKEEMAHPRNHLGSMNDGLPISSQDFPMLKHCFHTGSGREGKFSRFRDLPVYFPTQDPLEEPSYEAVHEDDETFHTVLSSKGQVVSQRSINQILKEAARVAQEVRLGADDKLMLATKGDPLSTLVGAVACLGARAQLMVPGRTAPEQVAKMAQVESVACALGDALQLESAAAPKRVARMA